MKLVLERFTSNPQSTLGLLFADNVFQCFTCEDAFHETKISGGTRVSSGEFEILLKPLGTSRLDTRYTQQFGSLHEGMLELQNVPNFTGVLIHVGNTSKDTEGCILVGVSANGLGGLSVLSSVTAYTTLYPKILAALKANIRVTITIVDRDR